MVGRRRIGIRRRRKRGGSFLGKIKSGINKISNLGIRAAPHVVRGINFLNNNTPKVIQALNTLSTLTGKGRRRRISHSRGGVYMGGLNPYKRKHTRGPSGFNLYVSESIRNLPSGQRKNAFAKAAKEWVHLSAAEQRQYNTAAAHSLSRRQIKENNAHQAGRYKW